MFEQESYVLDEKVSVQDQAALLLSIADIARCEMITNPSTLEELDGENNVYLKLFPFLKIYHNGNSEEVMEKSRNSPEQIISHFESNRLRTISIDSPVPTKTYDGCESPIPIRRSLPPTSKISVFNSSSLDKVAHRNQRRRPLSKRCSRNKPEKQSHVSPSAVTDLSLPRFFGTNRKLQGIPPKGISLKKIVRQKFSWKNYPEVRRTYVV